ncbi:uncharacterized protein LOC116264293 [Nymphaea colorata]|uniref:uncharacterized protein LOC116264293 n=1 Tax=Nymphaea colorata TaxID=210225 RepID=UPI00129EC333|nr:uncharacterized protein LOC116264293 [Nymphaea colorata]
MQEKFDKYFKSYNILFAIAVVLDPRFKLSYLKYFLGNLDKPDAIVKYEIIESTLHELYAEYKNMYDTDTCNMKRANASASTIIATEEYKSVSRYVFRTYVNSVSSVVVNTDLDKYLFDPMKEITPTAEFNILSWWKTNESKYKILVKIARDVLAIHVSTVASESAFSIAGRIINDYRCSTTPENVESLICTQSWIGEKKSLPSLSYSLYPSDFPECSKIHRASSATPQQIGAVGVPSADNQFHSSRACRGLTASNPENPTWRGRKKKKEINTPIGNIRAEKWACRKKEGKQQKELKHLTIHSRTSSCIPAGKSIRTSFLLGPQEPQGRRSKRLQTESKETARLQRERRERDQGTYRRNRRRGVMPSGSFGEEEDTGMKSKRQRKRSSANEEEEYGGLRWRAGEQEAATEKNGALERRDLEKGASGERGKTRGFRRKGKPERKGGRNFEPKRLKILSAEKSRRSDL